jgi:hypothetical protein
MCVIFTRMATQELEDAVHFYELAPSFGKAAYRTSNAKRSGR